MDHAFVELIQAKHNPRAMIDLMDWWWGRQRWLWWTKLAVVQDATTMQHSHTMVTRLCPASLAELPKGLGACEIFGLEIREAEAHRSTSMLWDAKIVHHMPCDVEVDSSISDKIQTTIKRYMMIIAETKRRRATHNAMINMERSRHPFTARNEGVLLLLLLGIIHTKYSLSTANRERQRKWGLPKK